MKTPELLCPVGGYDTLKAAIFGGADAVYFGTKDFNARMNAKNFTRDEVFSALNLCHENGVRAYVTMNTLLSDRNLPLALETVSFLYEAGCDGLILADVGLSSLIKKHFPKMELHASTQMSGHSLGAAEFLHKNGFSRMVLAREMDQDNIRYLCEKSPIETELFVHGAICASASGQCLMSSMIGDRSGNRGECAQPCRLPYNGTYPLSFKDLCLANHIDKLLTFGISSLKIEGRMKSPEYVYTVASTWRRLLDEKRNATKKELDALAGVFSRSGFTDGYFTKDLSPDMLGTRTDKDKLATRQQKITFKPSKRESEKIVISREKIPVPEVVLPQKTKPFFQRSARFTSPEQIPDTDLFHQIYLPLEKFDGTKANGVVLPSVIFPSEEEKVLSQLKKVKKEGA
ncbi:MAG: U32 family peptidase, partial [Clostridia bacterium]|nr:U32 family peptidase [Clostridia bacterium]